MNYLKYLKDNTCFIVPDNIKREILLFVSNNKMLVNISFYTIEELLKKVYFDYNEKTIYELSKKYNISYDDALLMINNMYYINDVTINDIKVNKLKEMKDYLDSNNLLIYDKDFLNYLNSKNIVTTYDKTNFLRENVFNKLNNVTFINDNVVYTSDVYEFNFIEDEVEFVTNKIANLIDSGININNIKLVNVNDTYNLFIKKIFSFYNIPVYLNERTSLYDLLIVKDFINILKEENSKESALEKFKEKYPLNNELTTNIYNKIINVLNEDYFIKDFNKDIEYFIKKLKKTYLKERKLENYIECIKVEEITNDSNYYFLIGFNNSFPKYYKDEDYLSDEVKKKLGFTTSNYINKNIKKYYINKLNNCKNLIITYKLKDYFNSYLCSTLIDEINCNLIKNYDFNSNISYSNKYDKIKLSKYLDDYYKYGYKNNNLDLLYNSYEKEYDTYDNKFKGLENNKFINYKNKSINLSYSSLDNFYKCKFKYYIANLINENDDTFATKVGELYHYVLSKMYDSNFDFERSYNEYISNKEFSEKENILLNKLKEELRIDINLLKEQISKGKFTKTVCEKKIEINVKSKASIILKGTIDKIMLTSDNKYAYVVDYKTGKPKINFDHLDDGLNMQLAIYMYLMHKSKEYADVFLVGCYLQKILDDDLVKDELKLDGYTYNDLSIIQMIDNGYFDSSFINGIKVKKDGSLRDNNKLFDSSYYEEVLNIVEKKVEEAIECILNNDFAINPKIVGGSNISCTYCKFKDICYHKYKDAIVIVEEDEDGQIMD